MLVSALAPIAVLYILWWKSCNCNCERYKEDHIIINDEDSVIVLDGSESNNSVKMDLESRDKECNVVQ